MGHSHPFPTEKTGVTVHNHSVSEDGGSDTSTTDAPDTDRAVLSISVAYTNSNYPTDKRDVVLITNIGVEQQYTTNPEPGEVIYPPNLIHWATNETLETRVKSNTSEDIELEVTANWAEIEI